VTAETAKAFVARVKRALGDDAEKYALFKVSRPPPHGRCATQAFWEILFGVTTSR